MSICQPSGVKISFEAKESPERPPAQGNIQSYQKGATDKIQIRDPEQESFGAGREKFSEKEHIQELEEVPQFSPTNADTGANLRGGANSFG